jgi:hypothetical protein
MCEQTNAYNFTEMQFAGSLVHAGPTAALRTAWCGAVGWFQAYTAITLRVHIINQLIIAGPTVSS